MTDIIEAVAAELDDRYELVGMIGRGGMATVYRARDLKLKRDVAIKFLRPDLSASVGSERFLREIEIAASLSHPHVLTLIDSGEAAGQLYYVMPFVDGESLRGRLQRERTLDLQAATAIVGEVAGALAHAHSRGVVHRDVKPENILLSHGHAMVTDFGIAKAISTAGGRLTRTGFPVGTPGYMSPEQAAGAMDLDGSTDVFSLAATCYEMLVGEVPGRWLTDEDIRVGRFPDLPEEHRERLDALPRRVECALARAMSLRPESRTATPLEFLDELRRGSHHADHAYASERSFSDTEVSDILSEAAAETDTATGGGLTAGSIRDIAREAGIETAQVRRAMERRESASIGETGSHSAFIGAPTRVVVEHTVNGEIYSEDVEEILAEIRSVTGFEGRSEATSRTIFWSARPIAKPWQLSDLGSHIAAEFHSAPRLTVRVTTRRGRTTVRVEEDMTELATGWFGGMMGGLGGTASALGIVAAIAVPAFPLGFAIIGAGALLGGTYGISRLSYGFQARSRGRRAHELADRVASLIDDLVND